jgi:hypothetical protein
MFEVLVSCLVVYRSASFVQVCVSRNFYPQTLNQNYHIRTHTKTNTT